MGLCIIMITKDCLDKTTNNLVFQMFRKKNKNIKHSQKINSIQFKFDKQSKWLYVIIPQNYYSTLFYLKTIAKLN